MVLDGDEMEVSVTVPVDVLLDVCDSVFVSKGDDVLLIEEDSNGEEDPEAEPLNDGVDD